MSRSCNYSRSVPRLNEYVTQQALGFFFQGQNVRTDFVKRAQRLRFIEVAGEGDFVADLGLAFVYPRVGRVRQNFAADECLDAAFFEQRNLFRVTQI